MQLVPTLQELTLRGNPVAEADDFRSTTIAILPELLMLDDEPTNDDGHPGVLVPDVDIDLSADIAFAAQLTHEELGDALAVPLHAVVQPSTVSPPPTAGSSAALGRSSIPSTPSRRSAGQLGASACSSPARGSPAPGEAQRREELLVARGIKYAEVGRIYDVAVDGRQVLSAGGHYGGLRPSTARPLVNTWTGSGQELSRPSSGGSSSRPSTTAGDSSRMTSASLSRPRSALGTSRGPLNWAGAGGLPLGSGLSRTLLSSPLQPSEVVAADDEASELTASADIICGVHKLRAHKLRRSVESLAIADEPGPKSVNPGAPSTDADSGPSYATVNGVRPISREARTLDDELMEQLVAVKIQELLSGGDANGPSDESDGVDEESGSGVVRERDLATMSLGADLLLGVEQVDDRGGVRSTACGGGSRSSSRSSKRGASNSPNSSGHSQHLARPTSSTDVTPTATPAVHAGNAGGVDTGSLTYGSPQKRSSNLPLRGAEGTPSALRHLEMQTADGDSAPEILQLS